jgi:hypothetical protein
MPRIGLSNVNATKAGMEVKVEAEVEPCLRGAVRQAAWLTNQIELLH